MFRRPRPRGYALMMVMIISLVLAIGIGTLMSYLAAAEKNSARQRLNREAFYVCDGVGRIISKTTVDVLSDSRFAAVAPTTDLEDLLMTQVEATHGARLTGLLGNLKTLYQVDGADGFVYRDVDVTTKFGQVGLGRFAGMNGQRRTFTYDLALRREGGSTCRTTATVDTVRVPLSELSLFAIDDTRICPSWVSADVARHARYHINGDLTVGNYALPRTTVTGTMSEGCGASSIRVCGSVGGCLSTSGGFAIAAASGSSNPFAASIAGLLADGERGTSDIKFPTSSARTQLGAFADAAGATDTTPLDNAKTMRFLVDPPATGDDAGAISNRLARLAQIRILDGVWYLNDGGWPGQPIWSDHPGSFTISSSDSPDEHSLTGSIAVGQDDLYSGTKPTMYSYGRTTPLSGGAVVSYGELVQISDRWEPGRGSTSGDVVGRAKSAARSGFSDVHTARQTHMSDPGRVLPINIDLAALNAALDAPTISNELGFRMSALGLDRSRVIVWVGGTWTGSLGGLVGAGTSPTPRPAYQGCLSAADASCDTSNASITNSAPLPYAMASQATRAAAKDRRYNAVRVYNGGAAASRRITIATPLPLYVLGSIDRGTAVTAPVGMPGLTPPPVLAANAPDFMFAADTVTLLSDHWNDGASWTNGVSGGLANLSTPELNTPPIYNASIVTGHYVVQDAALTPYGAERAVRFLERWPAADASVSPIVTGSIILGFRSVYNTSAACYGTAADSTCATSAPWRHFWSEALRAESQAPAGMPTFALRGVGETIPDSMSFNLSALLAMLAGFSF